MNLERGFHAPVERSDVWAPVTPEKPVEQRSNQEHKGVENWQDLLGIYTGVLQDGSCGLPPAWHPNSCVGVNPVEVEPPIENFVPVPQNIGQAGVVGLHNGHGVASAETCNEMLPCSCGSAGLVGESKWNCGIQDVAPIDKYRSFDQNAGSHMQNVGDVVTPRKVNSLAELLGMNGDGITSAAKKAVQNQDIGGYNLQQMASSRVSAAYRPSYNLNLLQRLEDGDSSSVTMPSHIGPATPDQHKLLKNGEVSQIPRLSIEEISTKGEYNKNFMLPEQAEIGQREHSDFVSDSLSTASPEISATKEKQNLVGGSNGEFDLNGTPPQKAPKRRKHRPKVVREGKPRRTPKPAAKENKNPGGDPPTKRKYVRKKDIKSSTNQSVDAENGVAVPNSQPQGKSCKRALNFDLENGVGKKTKCKESDHQEDNNKGSDASQNSSLGTGLNGQGTCTVEAVHQNIWREQKQTEHTYNFVPFVDKIPPQESVPHAATGPPTASKEHSLNVIARSLNVRNTNINQSHVQGKHGQIHHHTSGGFSQLLLLANTRQQNLDGLRQPRLQSTPQLLEDLVGNREKREPKREYSYTEPTQPLIVSQICSRGVSETGHFNKESIRSWQNVSSTKNAESIINGLRIPSGNTSAEKFSEQTGSPNKSLHAQTYRLRMNGGIPYFGIEEISTLVNPTYEGNKATRHWCMNSISSGLGPQKQMADIESRPFAEAQSNSSLTAIANCHMLSTSHGGPKVIRRNEMTDAPARVSAKRQYTRKTPANKMSSSDRIVQQETRNVQGYGYELTNDSCSREYKRNIFSVDDITDGMKNLQISKEEGNALVPYTGDGVVVPYEAFEPVKKRRPRPKVDLDPETNRLWNLLMGSEGSESAETMDEDKQKRWEEERRVFRGRVDSFIARMHLVQGDRRFSKWKGSVVDSVIGVYLTQNVSDHLSSSAFMSLAAKFPIKSTNIRDTSCQKAGNPSAEYVVRVSHPDGTTCHQRMTREPVYDHNTLKSSTLSEYSSEKVPSGTVNKHTGRTEEWIVSSQSSSGSMNFQASEDIRSSSGSNSEVDDQVTGSNLRENCDPLYLFEESGGITEFQKNQFQELGFSFADKMLSNDHQEYENLANRDYPGVASSTNACTYPLTTNAQHHQRPALTSNSTWHGMLMGAGNRETDGFASLEKECTSSITSTHCDTTSGSVIEELHNKAGQRMESRTMVQQTPSYKLQASTVNHEVLTKRLEKKMNLPIESESRDNQHFMNYKLGGMQETFQQESILTDTVKSAEALRQNPTDNQKLSENVTPQATEMKIVHASDVQSSRISTNSTARKQKAEKEKEKSFDWDSLRKHAQSKGGTRGRSRDIMDSLDYEALRNADVREISDCIKERGMNNMLAARIKDFLNRLVKDHGSIDLEWLRDVQPDKVKDYLLSIRGLGLKSVECIRLLTLHHLAFPVDTNVGRIAVRLGWVPLQPLPESLQLHLLELYPVLESIQKYLWPRLCMLDQETLYELHYQLITFGKVFCTKRQPNCNACPMRGECRHFASAFASARLALPGPEERRVVCSDVSLDSSKSCGIVTKPMSLPPPEDYIGSGPGLTVNCEPIIEEPATPESSIEDTERDIEDAFYEDPDEIPEIKLNIEEFTTNLKSFIQENNEMQEGDMSRAIIALSPQLASIPTPKLKHVSRLRTEHQVYELPDSHPLLEGMDRREPDDPSPYLLALWTPGETADSIQLPEGKCSSTESGMCNNKTCFPCNSTREAHAQTVRGTILIPCRTAMRGSFPLNGTYFQVNEVFADDKTSRDPIQVPRSLIWNLPRRTVFFGTSVSTIFKGMSTEGIQYCFWRGFVCVRGFDQKTRAPRPLKARLHLPASKIPKKNEWKHKDAASKSPSQVRSHYAPTPG